MRRAFGLADWPADVRGPVLALGTFDGIHLGHRRVLGLAVDRARARGGPSAALTFEPHPLEVLRPAHEPVLLSTVDERLEQFEALGIDVGLVLPFDDAFSKIAAAAWLDGVLRGRLDAREIVAGSSYTFGFRREGTARRLEAWGRAADVPVHLVPAVLAGGEPVSSSRIRAALREGLVEDAARLLGRCYRLAGRIVPGAGRGRTIGVPTANLATPPRKIVPAHGVYATVASVRGRRYRGATNIGTRPTFGGAGVTVETFLLDFEGDCTGDEMVLEFVRYLRGERAFPDAGALTRQIAQDVAAVRELPGEEEAGIM
ncbi:MAG TPA: bifunctional riboflavin kinase/FAD synthetase [bacterium]|nr:bifunctional riboflavin kinase/FAD synthetase [bacterium]